MKYIQEDFDPSINVEGGSIDIKDSAVEDAINRYISAVTAKSCVTPYIALEKVRKILAYYKIFLPQTVFLESDEGHEVFEISQFGDKMGMTDDGEVKVKNEDGLYLYFEWMMNEEGLFDVFSEIVDEDELDELLEDFDEEGEDEDNGYEDREMFLIPQFKHFFQICLQHKTLASFVLALFLFSRNNDDDDDCNGI
jgi:hypothetical protein